MEAPPDVAVDAAELARSMAKKLGDVDGRRLHRPTIYRVIASLRSLDDPSPYDPKVISIGPFHRDKEPLQAMEEHKWRYLHHLLSRNPLANLDKCIAAVGKRVTDIRGQYSDRSLLEVIADEQLVEMMVLDGCFILEHFIKCALQDADPTLLSAVIWATHHMRGDLLLLENQIPFFVLLALWEAMAPRSINLSLVELVLFTLSDGKFHKPPQAGFADPPQSIFHLLHFYHVLVASSPPPPRAEPRSSCWRATHRRIRKMGKAVPSVGRHLLASAATCRIFKCGGAFPAADDRRSTDPSAILLSWIIPSATKLREAGVKIERRERTASFLDMPVQVRFSRGTLGLPTLQLNRVNYTLLRNLITFEQCCPESTGSSFTSYIFLMMHLMRTDSDVELLQSCGVVVNHLGSIGDVLLFCHNALKVAALHEPFRFAGLVQDVRKYCKW